MRQAFILAVVTVLLVAGAFGRDLADDVVRESHRVAGKDDALPDRLHANERGQRDFW